MEYNEFKEKFDIDVINNYLDAVKHDKEGIKWFWKVLYKIKETFPKLDIYPAGKRNIGRKFGYIGVGEKLSLEENKNVKGFILVAHMQINNSKMDFQFFLAKSFKKKLVKNSIYTRNLKKSFSREDDKNDELEIWLKKVKCCLEKLVVVNRSYTSTSKGYLPKDYFEKQVESSFENQLEVDLEEINKIEEPEVRTRLVNARLGQGNYRKELLKKFNSRCILTGIDHTDVLIASHIKAWCACNGKEEKLDPLNGLLLFSGADSLFDQYLISFNPKNLSLVIQDDCKVKEILKKHLLINVKDISNYHLNLPKEYTSEDITKVKYYLRHHYSQFIKKQNERTLT